MALPMLTVVDSSAPMDDEIHVIVKSDVEAQLIRLYRWRHELKITSLAWKGSWQKWHPFRVAMRLRALRLDCFLAPHAADSLPAALFSKIIGARQSIGPAGRFGGFGYSTQVARPQDSDHKIERYSAYAMCAGFNESAGQCSLQLSDQAITKAEKLFGNASDNIRVVLAPMSSALELHKRWPLDSFAQLGQALLAHSTRIRIVILGAPAERADLEQLAVQLDPERTALVAQPSIEQTLAHLRVARCVVSGCTGPLHLATLVDVPVVALFGPTDPRVTGPTTRSVEVISAGLSCSPCYAPGFERGCDSPTCMTGIGVDQVSSAVLAMIDNGTHPTQRGN